MRAAYVDKACNGDDNLRETLASLLVAHAKASARQPSRALTSEGWPVNRRVIGAPCRMYEGEGVQQLSPREPPAPEGRITTDSPPTPGARFLLTRANGAERTAKCERAE